MRYLLIGLAVLAAVGTVCFVSGIALERDISDIADALSQSEESFRTGDLDGALELANAAREHWEKCSPFFDSVLHGEASASAERQIDVLLRLLENDPDSAEEAYSEAIEELRLISDGERMTLGNLF